MTPSAKFMDLVWGAVVNFTLSGDAVSGLSILYNCQPRPTATGSFFFEITQYNADAHNARTLTGSCCPTILKY